MLCIVFYTNFVCIADWYFKNFRKIGPIRRFLFRYVSPYNNTYWNRFVTAVKRWTKKRKRWSLSVRPSVTQPIQCHNTATRDACRFQIFSPVFSLLLCYSGWSQIIPVIWATYLLPTTYRNGSLFLDYARRSRKHRTGCNAVITGLSCDGIVGMRFYNEMCYINLSFTHSLTYLLWGNRSWL